MYHKIALPVDLRHTDKLDKAVTTAADIARHYGASLTFVAVTAATPSEIAHNPSEFSEKLNNYAAEQADVHGIEISTDAAICHDPAVELDEALDSAFHKAGVDLVVMASHVPGFREYVFSSNAGYLASHTDLSVMIVR
ncbi:MAG: universal stress protein [Gammaproteobacteria bacterium]|nr:universal stress protein [Gammaproteobacteria bacterium]